VLPSIFTGRKAAGSQIEAKPVMVNSCVMVLAPLGAGSKSGRPSERRTGLYESFDDHTVPSKVSSDVSRQ
jgi:hypothetical protein